MRKLVLIATLSALGPLFQADFASARGRCGGGRGGCGSCGQSYCGSCGYGGCGSCGYGGCGSCGYGGCGSCGYGSCGTAGYGGYCSSCAGGLCASAYTADPSTAVVQDSTSQTATLIVTLPEDAKVLVDGHMTTSTSAERVYTTPVLEDGKDYHYTLTIQVVRDGQTHSVTRDVTVHSGQTTRINVEAPTTAAVE